MLDEQPYHTEPCCPSQADEFTLHWSDLGDLREIVSGHDNSGQTPAWHLEQVEITDTKSGQASDWERQAQEPYRYDAMGLVWL